MTFAEDEVYKYVKRNMSKFHVIRVEQMLPFVSASLSVPDVVSFISVSGLFSLDCLAAPRALPSLLQ